MSFEPRLSYATVAPGVLRAVLGVSKAVKESDIEPQLLELVNLRASQINGCAYCLAMHATTLREMGEPDRRLDLLPAWREAPGYTERERAALAWTEALTRLEPDGVPDVAYETALAHFGDNGLVELTLAITTINTWNRLNVAFRNPPAD